MELLVRVGLSNAILATLLALLAAGMSRCTRRPAFRHGLWLLVLLKLLTPPIWPVQLPDLHWSRDATDASERSREDALPAGPVVAAEASAADWPRGVPVPGRLDETLAPAPREDSGAGPVNWTRFLGACWLAGSLGWLILAGWRGLQFRRLLRQAEPAAADLQELTCRLGARLGLRTYPSVWLVPGRVAPMLWALFGRPRLLLPRALWHRLAADEQRMLLAHELAHLRRRDHWVRWLELLALAVYWWHPALRWARRELHEAEEQCCDSWVVAVWPALADAYAEGLLAAVTFLSHARSALPVGASGIGQVHPLKVRLQMILDGNTPKALSRGGWLVLLVLAVVSLPLWMTSVPAQAQEQDEPRSAPPAAGQAAPDRPSRIDQARSEVDQLTADIQGMQARLRALEQRLRTAQARLARLEGRPTERPAAAASAPTPALAPTAEPLAGPPPVALAPVRIQQAYPYAPALGQPVPAPFAGQYPTTAPLAVPVPQGYAGVAAGGQHVATAPLALPQGPAPQGYAGVTAGADYEQRLRALEQKLDRLLRQLESQRGKQPAPRPGAGEPGVLR